MSGNGFIENLKQLFDECDTCNNGSLGRKEFNDLCDKIGLNKEAAKETFERLDIDKNGRITFDEFTAGFNQYKQTSSSTVATSNTTNTTNTNHGPSAVATRGASPGAVSKVPRSSNQTRPGSGASSAASRQAPASVTPASSSQSSLKGGSSQVLTSSPQNATKQAIKSGQGFVTGNNASAPTSLSASPQPPPPRFKPNAATNHGEQARPASAMSALPASRTKLTASASPIARKIASPLGVMSLGSTGSSNMSCNNISTNTNHNPHNHLLTTSNTSYARSSSAGADISDFNSVDDGQLSSVTDFTTNSSHLSNLHQSHHRRNSNSSNNVVVYSSEHIAGHSSGLDYDQAHGSGQFGSLISSNGSLNQVKNMQDLLESVQKLQSENQILTQIFFKDKREREEYISQLGEEFDQQVREVEERANRRAREELESEKKRLREMMQTERETLQHHYQTIEKMSHLIKTSTNGKSDDSEGIDKVKSKLEDTYLENRQLKKSLLDTKTDVALIWKEMERLKQQYEDKLTNAYQRNNETRSECDHIKQQLNLMKDSNRKLQDASDVITNYITDKVEPVIKGAIGAGDELGGEGDLSLNGCSSSNRLGTGVNGEGGSNSRRGSILSQYLNNGTTNNNLDAISNEGSNVAGSSVHSGDLESLGSSSRWGGRAGDDADGEALSGTSSSGPGGLLMATAKKKQHLTKLAKSPTTVEVSLTDCADNKKSLQSSNPFTEFASSSSPLKAAATTITTTTSMKKSSSYNNLSQHSTGQDFRTEKTLQQQQPQLKLQSQQTSNFNQMRLGEQRNETSSSINGDQSSSSDASSSNNFQALNKKSLNHKYQQYQQKQQLQQDDARTNALKGVALSQQQKYHNKITPHHSVSLIELSKTANKEPLTSNKATIRSKFGKRSLIGKHFFIGSRADSATANSDAQVSEAESSTTKPTTNSVSLDYTVDNPAVEPADGPSKATFDIILVGDSFVGKSSFAARFMEGSFVQGLISNCSIDFKTKAYKVDGINYTVNLWDTAGQERFRSITASYFRKADGIILMYDVTDKRSYLNVRNWMSTISDTANENVAVLLVGNKIDLRLKANKENCIPTKEGSRLAREYGIMFLETSVKTGMNLVPSMGKLIRLIAKNNMPPEEDKDTIKLSKKNKAFGCMC